MCTSATTMISVLLVDDHAIVRLRLKLLLQRSTKVRLVAEAQSGGEAFRKYSGLFPDVLIMNIAEPGAEGVEPLYRLLVRYPKARVVALSEHADPSLARHALQAGALGFLLTSNSSQTLVEAVAVAQGRRYLDPVLAQRLALAKFELERLPVEDSSEREFEMLVRFVGGSSVKPIALALRLPVTGSSTPREVKARSSNCASLPSRAGSHGATTPNG